MTVSAFAAGVLVLGTGLMAGPLLDGTAPQVAQAAGPASPASPVNPELPAGAVLAAGAGGPGLSASPVGPVTSALPATAGAIAAGINAAGINAAGINAAGINASRARRLGDRVIVRHPSRDLGSGFLGDYSRLRRLRSSAAQYRAAAASDNGCLILGDSIASMAKDVVIAELRRRHRAVCAWETWSGRPTEGAVNALADLRAAYGVPSTVIVMSGSNDIFNPAAFPGQVRRMLAVAGPGTRVVWVNVFARRVVAKRYAADVRNSVLVNRSLAQVARQRGTLQVIDWYRFVMSRTRPGRVYVFDGIHPNAAGQRALATLVANAW